MALAQSARPIEGAVATLGVSDRVAFLRKTYTLLGFSLIAFAAITGGMMRYMTTTSLEFSKWALTNNFNWLAVLGAFMVVGWVAQRLAKSDTSSALQILGLLIAVVGEAVLLQPMLWIAAYKFGGDTGRAMIENGQLAMSGFAGKIILEAVVITLAIFVGLTLSVFISKKDFSFMRSALTMCTFAALGIIIASLVFGFSLGAVFSGAMILLMSGYVLYQTSLVMNYFRPTAHVAAALMLFSTIATLFWYVLRILIELNGRR